MLGRLPYWLILLSIFATAVLRAYCPVGGLATTRNQAAEPGVRVISLTGGIASGKSTVAKMLAEQGIKTIDLDQVNKTVIDTNAVIHHWLVAHFGQGVIQDGKPDHQKLRQLFYVDKSGKKLFKEYVDLLTPIVMSEVRRQIAQAGKEKKRMVVLEDAELIESGRYRNWDDMVVVLASRKLREERVAERDKQKGTAAIAQGIFSRQTTDAVRRKTVADLNRGTSEKRAFLIRNAGTLDDLQSKVNRLVDNWRKRGWLDPEAP